MYGLWLFKELKTEYGYCKIEIFKKSYSSSPIEIEAVEANSLTLSIENLSETISPIGKSVCSFSIVDTGQLSYDDFFTPDATGIKVVISTINEDRGDVAYTTRWSGFVTPDFYSESLVYRTAINISARDNIGYLSDVEFDLVEPSIQIRELFSKAFAKISEQYPMDVMFRSHKTTEDGVLLTDAVISTALFKDKTWGEVLELILHDLGLQMRWVDNNTIAVIDLSQIPEYYLPTQFQFINSSGYKEICPAWRDLSQEQDFGIRENSFEGNITSQNLRFVDIEEPITPTTGGGAGNNYYESKIAYYAPTNWQTTGDIFTTDPAYYNDANSKKIYFTAANINDVHSRYMSWRQDISKTEIPLSISFKALNSLSMPSRIFGEEGVEAPRILIPFKFNKVTISKFDGGTLQIGIIYDIFLYSGLKKYKLNYNWVDVSDGTQTAPLKFVLPEMYFSGEDDDEPPVPKEEECVININGIPATGELEFVIYGWYFITIQDTWNETFNKGVEWEKFFAYVNDVTYTFENNSKGTGQEAKTSINPLHNILRNEKYQFGNVPKYGGGLSAYAGGLFNLVGEELSTFKRNEDSPAYNLLELVGREIIHFNKKNYNKLSGEIKSPTKKPLKFNSLFSREGKLYYPFSCSLNVIDNTMTITSMQEVEPYTTESFTEIHSEVKSDGGTTVSGGNNTVLQYSEDAGNAKRLYEMQDATLAEKEKAFALVDSPDFPQARRIRVADLIGLDEQALAQYLELNKYLQVNDLTPITNRIGAVEGYFTNGSAKDALKLGGIDAGNYWHKGNSGTLDYDWKAKKLNVRTLVIPTSEPTDLSQGEVGFYLGTAGQGAEEPNGSGGLDLTELWAELSSEDYAKKIHISHIPTIQYSSIAGRPSALANPHPLTINKVVYDGSEPITLNIGEGGGVADSVAWGNVFNKPTTISGYGITDAYTKDSVDLKLSNYLPKSGGILDSGSNQVPLILNSVGETTRLAYRKNGTTLGYLGFSGVDNPVFINSVGGSRNLLHSGNYSSYALPLSGGILESTNLPLQINRLSGSISSIGYNLNSVQIGILGFDVDGNFVVSPNRTTNSTYYNVIHTGNIGSQRVSYATNAGNADSLTFIEGLSNVTRPILVGASESGKVYYSSAITINYALQELTAPKFVGALIGNASSATQLQTPRTIWGQSFNGSGNVDGWFRSTHTDFRMHYNTDTLFLQAAPTALILGEGTAATISTYILGKDIRFGTKLSSNAMIIANSGNILIGTTTDNGSGAKLQVEGGVSIGQTIDLRGRSGSAKLVVTEVGADINYIHLFVDSNNSTTNRALVLQNGYGNILIGTPNDNGYKLQVNGTLKANGLIIPTSAPTDLKDGDHALYLGSVGEGAELPSGAGGLDVAELWAELGKADESKQINVSHIPTIEIARVSGLQTALNNKADASALSNYQPLITSSNKLAYSLISGTPTIPTTLKNPYALTFGSKTYDGSSAKTITASDLGALTSHQDISHLLSKTDASNTYQTKITSTNKIPYSNVSGTPTLASVATSGKYSDLSGVPTSLPASDVYAWAKKSSLAASDVPNLDWSKITSGKPTTLSGYGITDKVAYRKTCNNFIHDSNEFTFVTPAYSGWIWINYRTASGETDGAITEYRFANGAGSSYADIRAAKYIVNGGTSSQFLKADGSLDSTSYLPLSGGTIESKNNTILTLKGSATNIYSVAYFYNGDSARGYVGWNNAYGIGVYNAANNCSLGIKDDATPIYHNGSSFNTLIHSGNIGSYAFIPRADKLISNVNADNYWSNGAYLNQTGNGSGNSNFPNDYAMFLSFNNGVSKYVTQFNMGRGTAYYRTKIDSWSRWYQFITDENIGSQSVDYANSAGNAERVAGFPITSGTNKPWNSIPAITPGGYMDVGRHFEFHYDNTTGSDYSTILMCTGNYSNVVYLPSASGTLALLTDNVASATKLQTARSIWGQTFDGTANISGDLNLGDGVIRTSKSGTDRVFIDFGSAGDPYIGYGTASAGIDTHICGNTIFLQYGMSRTNGLALTKKGHVLIGTTTDNGARLQVNGGISLSNTGNKLCGLMPNNAITSGGTATDIWLYNTTKVNLYGSLINLANNTTIAGNLTVTGGATFGGNVLIGTTTDNGSKLQVNGAMEATELVIPTAPPTNPQPGKHYLYLA